jgi:ABC-2 type transport system permease protein
MTDNPTGSASRAVDMLGVIRQTLAGNPVMVKELRGRMRGARAFIILTIYLGILVTLVSLVYFAFTASSRGLMAPEIRQNLGKIIFGVVVAMELFLVIFVSPGLTAGAISSEREQQTLDLLRTTLLPARSLVFGKLLAALSFIFMLLLATLPLQSLTFLFGGIAREEFIIANILLMVSALAYTSLGMVFSSIFKRTLVATVLAYACAIFIVFGLPILVYTVILSMSVFLTNIGQLTQNMETLLVMIGWLIIAVNPLTTVAITEVILIEQRSIFLATVPLNGDTNYLILSPWIGYSLIYLLLSLLFIFLSIRFTRQAER